jgi:hypothetical protein
VRDDWRLAQQILQQCLGAFGSTYSKGSDQEENQLEGFVDNKILYQVLACVQVDYAPNQAG